MGYGSGTRSRRRRRLAPLAVIGCLALLAQAAPGAMAGDDASGGASAGATAPVPPAGVADRLVVELARPEGAGIEAGIAAAAGGRHVDDLPEPGVFAVEVAPDDGEEALRRLRADTRVARAERDVRFRAADVGAGTPVIPNERCFSACTLTTEGADPQEFGQKEMATIGAPKAWATTKGDPGIIVAVIDGDVDIDHPDLAGKVIEGPNYSNDDVPDPEGHGTAVAGLIAAQPDNGIGIAGLGWNTRVLAIRVLDHKGTGFASKIATAIEYAADYDGVRVINLSLQQSEEDGDVASSDLRRAIAYAQERGVLIVAAAGNHGLTDPQFPANFQGVLSVNAVDHSDEVASFSNRGPWVDVAAPGVGILSLAPDTPEAPGGDRFSLFQGTSFAAPLVSAAAALVMAADPSLGAHDVGQRLEETADVIPASGTDVKFGRINVARAVGVRPAGGPASPPAPTQQPPSPSPPAPPTPVPPAQSPPAAVQEIPAPAPGYWLAATDGGIFSHGSSRFLGSTGAVALNRPVVGMAAKPGGEGYWLVASDGGIFAFGDALFHGSTGAVRLNRPIVGMAPTLSGRGYWLVASDGGIFAFGDALFHGSTGAVRINRPIVGMAPTPSGRGYWLVASDGGIFAFGDAVFRGSTGDVLLNRPIVGMAAAPAGGGYWMVASDGGIFTFGAAGFWGSTAGRGVADIVGMAPHPSGDGYWLAGADGAVHAFGVAPDLGHPAGPLNRPVVGLAVR